MRQPAVVMRGPPLAGKQTLARQLAAVIPALTFLPAPHRAVFAGSAEEYIAAFADEVAALHGCRCVVLVLDSQVARIGANERAVDDLGADLAFIGRGNEEPRIVAFANKRDLPDLVSLSDLRVLVGENVPVFAGSALRGEDVTALAAYIARAVLRAELE